MHCPGSSLEDNDFVGVIEIGLIEGIKEYRGDDYMRLFKGEKSIRIEGMNYFPK